MLLVVVAAEVHLVAEHFLGYLPAVEMLRVAAPTAGLVLAVHVPAVHYDVFAAEPVVGGELS